MVVVVLVVAAAARCGESGALAEPSSSRRLAMDEAERRLRRLMEGWRRGRGIRWSGSMGGVTVPEEEAAVPEAAPEAAPETAEALGPDAAAYFGWWRN